MNLELILKKEMLMNELIIQEHLVKHQKLEGVTVDHHTIRIQDNFHFSNPLIISVLDDSMKELFIEIKDQTEVNIRMHYDFELTEEKSIKIHFILADHVLCKLMTISHVKGKKFTLDYQTYLNRDAKLDWIGLNLNEQNETIFDIYLKSQGAEVDFKTLTLSSKDHIQTIFAHINHQAPHTKGNMNHVGIANEQGKIQINGVGKIFKGMKNSSAFQTLKGVILSHKAFIEVNPYLLIDEYDVKAGHGATVGKIDEEMLYYMKSRGLRQTDAERLILLGHINPIIDTILDDPLKELLMELILSRL